MKYTLVKKTSKKRISKLDIALLLCGLALLFTPAKVGGGLLILSAVLSVIFKKPESFTISESGLVWNALFSKTYDWIEVEHLILKDGLLTIDLFNNRLIQTEVIAEGVDEATINNFCTEQLSKRQLVIDGN